MLKTTTPKTAGKKKVVRKNVIRKEAQTVKKIKPIVDEIKISTPEAMPQAVVQPAVPAAQTVKTRAIDFVIFGSLFLIFLLCPLFFTGLAAQGIVFEKMILFFVLVLIGAASWAVKMAVAGEIKFKRTVLDLPILAALAVFIISTITAVNQWASFAGSGGNSAKGLMAFVVFVLFYYLIINNIDAKKIRILFWAMVFSFSVMLVFSLLQILGIFVLPFGFAQSASFTPAGSLSSLVRAIVIIIPALIFCAVYAGEEKTQKTVLLKWILIAVSLIGFIILAALNKIVFWPAAIAGMAVLLFFILLRKIKISNNNLIIPITAFLLLVIFFVLGNLNIGKVNVAGEPMLSYGESWNIAKNGLKENPLFGSGLASFYYDFSRSKSADFNMTQLWNLRFTQPSGFLFEALTTVGSLGALAILAIIIFALFYLWKSIFRSEEAENKNLLVGLFSSLISAVIIALFMPLNDYMILIAVIIGALAFAAAAVNGKSAEEINMPFKIASGKNYFSAAVFIACLAAIAGMFVFNAKIYLADFYAGRAFAATDTNGQIENLGRAVKFAPREDFYRINLANSYIISANQAAGEENPDKNKILDNLSQAVGEAKIAVKISPEKAANSEFLALVYEQAASYEGLSAWSQAIKDIYGKVIELEPANPIPYYKLALINIAESDAEQDQEKKNSLLSQAVENYDKAISLKSDLAPAYYGKGIASEKKNDLSAAIEDLKNAVEKSGGNIDYAFELGRVYFNRGVASAEPAEAPEDEVAEDVEDGGTAQTKIKRNEDINIANQIFLSILQIQPSHANALYSLALIYQAAGEDEDMKLAVERLLNVVADEGQKEKIRTQFGIGKGDE